MQDVGLIGAADPAVLAWAAEHGRILLSHDRVTMVECAYRRVVTGDTMPGLRVLNDRFPVGQAIDEILLIVSCTEQAEWTGRVVYLPL